MQLVGRLASSFLANAMRSCPSIRPFSRVRCEAENLVVIACPFAGRAKHVHDELHRVGTRSEVGLVDEIGALLMADFKIAEICGYTAQLGAAKSGPHIFIK